VTKKGGRRLSKNVQELGACFKTNKCQEKCRPKQCIECTKQCENEKSVSPQSRKCKRACKKNNKCKTPKNLVGDCKLCKKSCLKSVREANGGGLIQKYAESSMWKCVADTCDGSCEENDSEDRCEGCKTDCTKSTAGKGRRALRKCKKQCKKSGSCQKNKAKRNCRKCTRTCKRKVVKPCHKACGKLCNLRKKTYEKASCESCIKDKCDVGQEAVDTTGDEKLVDESDFGNSTMVEDVELKMMDDIDLDEVIDLF